MPSDRISILYNPSAGMGRALRRKIGLERLLRHLGVRYDLVMTQSEAHLRELTRAHAQDYPVVVGAGGDSTFHIMIGELAAAGGGAAFGMIGVGSSNDIPREFGMETLVKAGRALKEGRTRAIDLGLVRSGGTTLGCFLGQANVGLGAYVNRYVAGLAERKPRLARRQLLAGVLGVRSAYKSGAIPLPLALESAAGRREGAYAAVVFSNIRYWATGRRIAPAAKPDDGILDCCLIAGARFLRLAAIARLAKSGRHVGARGVEMLAAPEFRVTSATPFAVQVDGEILRAPDGAAAFREASIGIVRGGLKLIVP